MLTNKYQRKKLEEISVLRDTRQRREIDTSDLDQSIRVNGVIQPIIIRPRNEDDAPGTYPLAVHILVAGERRYTSSAKNGLLDIPVRFTHELTKSEAELIELEENLKRVDLTWRDLVRSISRLHDIYSQENATWSQASTSERLSLSPSLISIIMRVARDLESPKLAQATSYRAAYNILSRQDERKQADLVSDIVDAGIEFAALAAPGKAAVQEAPSDVTSLEEEALPPDELSQEGKVAAQTPKLPSIPKASPPPRRLIPAEESIMLDSFLEWAPSYEGPKFNFIHCDFPYGINAFGGEMSGKNEWETYDDSPDVYWTLIKCLCSNLDRIMAPSAHLMFWFSMEHYHETLEAFRKLAPSLAFQKFPLIWTKSDNVGILTDAKRGPRRVYETAFIASRGDRPIVKPVGNSYPAPTDKQHHHSTKPVPVLRHFFQMFVDEHSKVLDPTCGSGSALRAAESMGASFVFGLEQNEEHCGNARKALRSFRVLEAK